MTKKFSLLLVLCTLLLTLVACTSKVTVTFDTAGGSQIASVQIDAGGKIQLPANPTKEGYTFVGWFLEGEPFDGSQKIDNNITLVAHWKKTNPKTLTVVFMVDGQKYDEKTCLEEELLTDLPKNPSKENSRFVGWFVDDNTQFDFTKTPLTEDLIVNAHFDLTSRVIVYAVALADDFVEFNNNRATKTEKNTEFADLTQSYVVGDDNPWKVEPHMSFRLEDIATGHSEPTIVDEWEYTIRVYHYNGSDYELLETTTDLVDKIDPKLCTIDFAEKAVGETFKIEVVPTGLTEKQLTNVQNYTMVFENFVVVDGYNVYEAKELAYVEYRTINDKDCDTAWDAFKDANGFDKDYHPANVILHTNIEITASDVPSIFFYTQDEINSFGDSVKNKENAVGSMKDWYDLYMRDLGENESFALLGNYYTLSTEHLREVVVDTDNYGTPTGDVNLISHATLIKIRGAATATSKMANLHVIGNAPRTDNEVKSGGQILVKVEGSNFTAYNNITICSFITYMPNRTDCQFLIEKCKGYENFNSLIYNWGSANLIIKDSEFIGAGGPVVIQDHVRDGDYDKDSDVNGFPAKAKVINSKLESYVTGEEGWFALVGASTLVPLVKGLNEVAFVPKGRSFLKNSASGATFMNLIFVNKSGSTEGLTNEKIKASFQFDELPAFDYGAFDGSDPVLKGMLASTYKKTHAFQTTGGGMGFVGGSVEAPTINAPLDQMEYVAKLLQGDYLCIYAQNGMSFGLQLFNAGETYEI